MTHVYTAALLLAGPAHTPVPNGAVVVDGRRLTYVGPAAGLPDLPGGTARTDLPDATLLPGLIDVHVHLGYSGDGSDDPPERYDVRRDVAVHLRNARRQLSTGVTTVRNLGSREYVDVAVRDAIADGLAAGPRVLAAGPQITTTGGHAWRTGGEVDSVDDIRHLVRTHHKAGVDVIKVMATGGFNTPGSAPWNAQFSQGELEVLVAEAHRLGKNTAAHAHGHAGIARALAAGIDTLEHVSMFDPVQRRSVFDPVLADAIAAKGTFVDTTCEWRVAAIIASGAAFSPPVRQLFEHGVRLVTGTDAGIAQVPHHAFVGGLRALHSLGIPAEEILRAATSRAAEAIGLSAVTGQLIWSDLLSSGRARRPLRSPGRAPLRGLVEARAVSVSLATRGHADMRGLVTAGRRCSAGADRASRVERRRRVGCS